MYTVFYTVEEGGKLREFGPINGSILKIVDGLKENRIFDKNASVPHPYTKLADNCYVSSVTFMKGEEWIGAYHAGENRFVYDETIDFE